MKKLSCLDRPIVFDSVANINFNKHLANGEKAKKLVLLDENTHQHCWPLLAANPFFEGAELIELPAGELSKTLDYCAPVWQSLTEMSFTRSDILIAVGGGVLTDLGGFIASSYKRGMRFMSIPTSLLGMVDASIGGKTGIDFLEYKNQLGAFYLPELIAVDAQFLETLPDEEVLNGMAEMLKHGLLADKSHAEGIGKLLLEKKAPNLEQIAHSMKIKIDVVEQDPKEAGVRKLLNLGHTIGHAIEKYWLTRDLYPHGFAVAQGLKLEARLANKLNLLNQEDLNQIEEWTNAFPLREVPQDAMQEILEAINNDKKNKNQDWLFSLPVAIGKSEYDIKVNRELVEEVLREESTKR